MLSVGVSHLCEHACAEMLCVQEHRALVSEPELTRGSFVHVCM